MSDTDSTIDSDELKEFLATKRNQKKLFQISKKQSEPSKPCNKLNLSIDPKMQKYHQRISIEKAKNSKKTSLHCQSEKFYGYCNAPADSNTEGDTHRFLLQTEKNERKPFRIPKRKQQLHDISDSDSDDGTQNHKGSVIGMDITDSDSDDGTQNHKGSVIGMEKKKNVLSNNSKPLCKYGDKCYRKNMEHLKAFSHETGHNSAKRQENLSSPEVMRKKGKHGTKDLQILHQEENIFGFYFTKVSGIPEQYNFKLALDIKDILSPSHGRLIASAQFNYMIDIPWLMQQYPTEFRKCPLTIVHGEQRASKQALEKSAAGYPNIKFCQAKLEIMYGTHHTKMMLLLYEDGLRTVIHTSNLVDSDWFQKTQGMWVSPKFPKLKGTSLTEGESCTNFKAELIEYLASYNNKELEEWILHVKKHDLSKAKVFIIGSSPGRHVGSRKTAFGHLKLRKILFNNGPSRDLVKDKWPVIGQFSSIGSLGSNSSQWLCGEWLMSLATAKDLTPTVQSKMLKLIYPTVDNVRCSLEGYPAGASLPYSYSVALKQPYLKDFLHQWKSSAYGRTEASPHIKTYVRISPNNDQIAWLLITSANLSKAAWGALEKKGEQLMIRSYELGVLFLPSQFNVKDAFFESNSHSKKGGTLFPVPFDLPLTLYESKDQPWIWDIPHIHAPDRYNNKWCPK